LWLYLSLESPGFNDEGDPEKGQMHLIFILQALPTQYISIYAIPLRKTPRVLPTPHTPLNPYPYPFKTPTLLER
jgi:hypothetical protein